MTFQNSFTNHFVFTNILHLLYFERISDSITNSHDTLKSFLFYQSSSLTIPYLSNLPQRAHLQQIQIQFIIIYSPSITTDLQSPYSVLSRSSNQPLLNHSSLLSHTYLYSLKWYAINQCCLLLVFI